MCIITLSSFGFGVTILIQLADIFTASFPLVRYVCEHIPQSYSWPIVALFHGPNKPKSTTINYKATSQKHLKNTQFPKKFEVEFKLFYYKACIYDII